jgi:hypothetical protein
VQNFYIVNMIGLFLRRIEQFGFDHSLSKMIMGMQLLLRDA